MVCRQTRWQLGNKDGLIGGVAVLKPGQGVSVVAVVGKCPMCGGPIGVGTQQCPKCKAALGTSNPSDPGTQRTLRISKCPRCGAEAQQGDVICVACGTNLLTGRRVTVSTASSEIRVGTGLTWSDVKPWIIASSVVVAAVAALILVFVFVLRDYTVRGKTLLRVP